MKVLQVKDLKIYFDAANGPIKVIDGISFDIEKNSVFGLVGSSGSGKTLTALSILRLIPEGAYIAGGSILFGGVDLLKCDNETLRRIRGSKISMVFQDPSASLNPVFTVGYQVAEAALAHQDIGKAKAKDVALEYLGRVHIPDPQRVFRNYPHQLSGGMKQRVNIAMALINSPELLILDEPTTALDVKTQDQILSLLEEIVVKERLSMLFISHDAEVVSRMCDEVKALT